MSGSLRRSSGGSAAGTSPKRARRGPRGAAEASTPTPKAEASSPTPKASRPATAEGRVRVMAAISCPPPPPEATELELPRTAVSLNTLYKAMAGDGSGSLVCERGRWVCDPESDAVRVVPIVAKDQYEDAAQRVAAPPVA